MRHCHGNFLIKFLKIIDKNTSGGIKCFIEGKFMERLLFIGCFSLLLLSCNSLRTYNEVRTGGDLTDISQNQSSEIPFQLSIESNHTIIKANKPFTIFLNVKNVSQDKQNINMNYFYNKSWRLDITYINENNEYSRIKFGIYMHIQKILKNTVILNPYEEYTMEINGVLRMDSFVDMMTIDEKTKRFNIYTGYALVFENDGIYFPVLDNIDAVKIIFKINDGHFLESNEIKIMFLR
jgi:hypothetical protein